MFLGTGSALIVPALPIIGSAAQPATGSGRGPAPRRRGCGAAAPSFPTQDPALVREMVGVSHGNLARVKELVERQPALARATYDWGFGDWESALDAASHVGNREIALFLLANGARPTIFSAAMLGQLDVVKAFVAATPGVQRTLGPHGITLLAHATAGRDQARPVLEYLEQLGDANPRLESPPLTDAEIAALSGTYHYGSEPHRAHRHRRRQRAPRIHARGHDEARPDRPRPARVLAGGRAGRAYQIRRGRGGRSRSCRPSDRSRSGSDSDRHPRTRVSARVAYTRDRCVRSPPAWSSSSRA